MNSGRRSIAEALNGRVELRFGVTPDRLAGRLTEIADRAGENPASLLDRLRLDDLCLATACADGRPDAWAECERLYFAFIRDFARRFLPDTSARDLADQVIADLWQVRKIAMFEARSTLKTWFGTVVAHAALNAGKAASRTRSLDEGPGASQDDGGRAIVPRAEARDTGRALALTISRAVRALPPEQKLLLQLYYEQDLTLEQIETVLRVPKSTLSRRLKRAREYLKAQVNALARESFGQTADAMLEGLELNDVELDLSRLFRSGTAQEEEGSTV